MLKRALEYLEHYARSREGRAGGSYVVVDFAPLELGKGRPHHDSVALGAQAPAGVVALWKTLFAAL